MTNEIKNFIENLKGLTPVQTAILLMNRLYFGIYNVVKHPNGDVEFDQVTAFHLLERVTLKKELRALWDLFCDFNNPKNASAVLLTCLEQKRNITRADYDNQGKLTPKGFETEPRFAKVKSYQQFMALLNDEAIGELEKISEAWLKDSHIAQTSFDFFFINGTDGVTFKQGDYFKAYDMTYGQEVCGRVLNAGPAGFVTAVDNGGYYSISAASQPKPCNRENLPADVLELLDSTFDRLMDESEEEITYRIEKAMKSVEKAETEIAKQAEKAQKLVGKTIDKAVKAGVITITEKAEAIFDGITYKHRGEMFQKRFQSDGAFLVENLELAIVAHNAKIEEDKKNVFKTLLAMKITTAEEIAKAGEMINLNKFAKEQKDELRTKLSAAKAAIKAQESAAKEAEKAAKAAEKAATAEKVETPAPKVRVNRNQTQQVVETVK